MSGSRGISGNTFGDGAQLHQGDVNYHGTVQTLSSKTFRTADDKATSTDLSSANPDSECLRDLYMTNPQLDKARIEQAKGGLLRASYRWILEHPAFTSSLHNPDSGFSGSGGIQGKGRLCCFVGSSTNFKYHELPS